ncbi:MAG: Na+/H+ antiporter NhaA [Deltaproteobacteria bacterium]|nr:Na+/H+ antiporter NhaA [Deltaproteobacteria bacterium]
MTATRADGAAPLPPAPPGSWEPLIRLARFARRPLDRFLKIEAASGILLLLAAAVALVWANSPWAGSYRELWHLSLGVKLGPWSFERSLDWVVNDGLMVIFFFVVGLEIRRELHHGELSSPRRAALPAIAALGGMVAPALLYLTIAGAPATRSGWGVPMATDIAFAVGILTLLGRRVPASLRVLLLALAVIDDLGAIIVIAVFYSSGVSIAGFVVAALGIGWILAMQGVGVRTKLAYVVPALVVWGGTYAAGVHPTIAGVIVGLLTPVRAWLGSEGFAESVGRELESLGQTSPATVSSHDLAQRLRRVDLARREAMSPAESLIESLHPWVAFGVMPIFALANAGVSLGDLTLGPESTRAALGTAIGLVLGKPVGVLLSVALALKLGVAVLPSGLTWRHLTVLGVVAGIGFTMALFIAQLAFAQPTLLVGAKLGILGASAVAAIGGLLLGRLMLKPPQGAAAERSADEAEAALST